MNKELLYFALKCAVGWILFFIIIICIRLLFIKKPVISTIDYDDLINNLKTGDLFLVKYDSIHGVLISLTSGSIWSHTAFVYKDKIIEMSYYDKENSGLCVLNIQDWLNYNKDRIICYKRWLGPALDESKIDDILLKYKTSKLDMNLLNWLKSLLNQKWEQLPQDKNKFFCSELIAFLLQELNVIKKEKLPCNYKPCSFENLENYDKSIVFLCN